VSGLADALLAARATVAAAEPTDTAETRVRAVARVLRDAWSVHWSEAEARKADADVDVRPVLRDLAALEEFAWLRAFPIVVEWTTRARYRRDAVDTVPLLGACTLVPLRERELTAGEAAPWLRLSLSIPAWLVADPLERERGLHALLMGYVPDLAERPTKLLRHRPDIVAHSATLGRYGAADAREGQAIGHAVAHVLTARWVEASGQLCWTPTASAIEAAEAIPARVIVDTDSAGDGPPKRRRKGAA